MPDELRRRRQNDEHPPAANEDPYLAYHDFDLPAYVGSTSFQKLPVLTDAAARHSTMRSAIDPGPASGRGPSARPPITRGA